VGGDGIDGREGVVGRAMCDGSERCGGQGNMTPDVLLHLFYLSWHIILIIKFIKMNNNNRSYLSYLQICTIIIDLSNI
jgi:hypothetical protein